MSEYYPEDSYQTPEIAAMNAVDVGTEPELVSLMTRFLQARRPSWTPNTGNIEVMLFEAFAIALNAEMLAIRNLPYELVRQLLSYDGVIPDDGAVASTRVEFRVLPSLDAQVIPAGTRLRLTLDESVGESVDLLTEEPVTIYPDGGNNVGYASAVGEFMGSAANGTPAGTPLEVIDNLPMVDGVYLYTPVLGGRDPETEEQYAARAEQARSAKTTSLARVENFENYAAGSPLVGRAHVLDLYDPAIPGVVAPGHITLVVTDPSGSPLTESNAAALEEDIADMALASLNIHVIAPTYTTVDMAITVRVASGYDPEVVSAGVEEAIRAWLTPERWDWAPAITPYMVVGRVDPIPGVAEVIAVPATINLPGAAPLAQAGVITVSVTY